MITVHRQGQVLKGRHVLIIFLAFFGVIFLVNGIFLYSAISTYTGVVANEPYRKGLDYNARIAADERQKQLGWAAKATLDPASGLTLTLRKADGAPVSGLFVTGVLGRPSTNEFDRKVVLTEQAPGRYVAPTDALSPGAWLVNLEAVWIGAAEKDPVYRMRERLWVKS